MPESKAFKQIKASLTKEYYGKYVPMKYRARYGKTYGRKDIRSFSYAVARSKGIKTDK